MRPKTLRSVCLLLLGIRRAILEGDIDKALDRTKTSYPQVLEANEQVHFRLRCRKFIEMIRREAETNLVGAGGPKGTANIRNGHRQPPAVEDMELDEDMEDLDGAQDQQEDLTEDALRYGQTLLYEYKDDDRAEVHQALNEIFGLMAYGNPLKEPKAAHLLDRKGRVAVAEELNSAILRESLPSRFSHTLKTDDRTPRISWQVIPRGVGEYVCTDVRPARRPGRDGRPRGVRHPAERYR